MKIRYRILSALVAGIVLLLSVSTARAIPAFARKYETSCSTCHYAFPRLNSFGRAFKNNGYRYPGGDENFVKEEPVSLGADASKRAFPNTIWPADIPGKSPFAVQMVNQMQYYPNALKGAPKLNFEFPHDMEIFAAGTVGKDISGWAELDMEGQSTFGYSFWLQWDYKPQLHVRAGEIEPIPTTANDMFRLSSTVYNYANFDIPNTNFVLSNASPGLEFWGAGNGPGGKGGFVYRLGVVNGSEVGLAHTDADNRKDFFAEASWKFGGLGEIGGTKGQSSKTGEYFKDNSAKLNAFAYFGSDDQWRPDSSVAPPDSNSFAHNFNMIGLNADIFWERANLIAVYAMRRDKQFQASDLKSAAWMTELDYVLYPWLIPFARYENTDKDLNTSTPPPETNLIPGVVVMLRANAKLTLEYAKPLDTARKKQDLFILAMTLAI